MSPRITGNNATVNRALAVQLDFESPQPPKITSLTSVSITKVRCEFVSSRSGLATVGQLSRHRVTQHCQPCQPAPSPLPSIRLPMQLARCLTSPISARFRMATLRLAQGPIETTQRLPRRLPDAVNSKLPSSLYPKEFIELHPVKPLPLTG